MGVRGPARRSVLGPFLKSCGFRDSAVRWLPASAPDGQNMVSPPQAPQLAAWWSGPTLLDAIDTFAPGGRAAAPLPLRMCVSDLFRTARGQSLVGGKIEVRLLPVLRPVTSRDHRDMPSTCTHSCEMTRSRTSSP